MAITFLKKLQNLKHCFLVINSDLIPFLSLRLSLNCGNICQCQTFYCGRSPGNIKKKFVSWISSASVPSVQRGKETISEEVTTLKMRLWIWKWFLVLILLLSLQLTPCFSWRRRRRRITHARPPPNSCHCERDPLTCFIEMMDLRGNIYTAQGLPCSMCGPPCPSMSCKKKGTLQPGRVLRYKCEP